MVSGMTWEEACQELGVSPRATPEEIKAAYEVKVWTLHPDRLQGAPDRVRKKAEEELKRVNAAYNFLKDPRNNPFNNPPKLDITPKYIRFKDVEPGQKKSTSLEIKSIGGPYTKVWIDNAPTPWLRVTDIKSLTSDPLPLEVTIEATGGTRQPSTQHTCYLAVRLENEITKSKDEVMVKVDLCLKAKPPILKAHEKSISFLYVRPNSSESKTFELENVGGGMLQGYVSTTKLGLSVSPNTVSISASAKDTYAVTVTTASLPYGFTDTGYINIITNGGDATIPVELLAIPKPSSPKPPRGFSFKEFGSTLLWFIFGPILPPFLIGTAFLFLFTEKWPEPLRLALVYIYAIVALAVSVRRGMKQDKQ